MKQNIFERVTARILEQMEAAAGDWTKPWIPVDFGGATNALTGVAYKGGNSFILGLLGGGYWATYRQWQTLGAQVRKGEEGVQCIKWVNYQQEVPQTTGDSLSFNGMFPNCFTVFSAAQVDGWQAPPPPEPMPECERMAMADAIVAATGASIRQQRQDRAYYAPAPDYISLPALDQFASSEDFYSVLMHELTHWTGHSSRLDRLKTNGTGKRSDYAFEELVAEIGAAFLLAGCGLSVEPRQDHAEYLASWIKYCKTEPNLIISAASQAQKAFDYIVAFSQPAQEAAA